MIYSLISRSFQGIDFDGEALIEQDESYDRLKPSGATARSHFENHRRVSPAITHAHQIMATKLSLQQFIRSKINDCEHELANGKVQIRNTGTYPHSRLQALLGAWFENHRKEWDVRTLISVDISTGPATLRRPDITVITRDPLPDILVEPPLLVIEIHSPRDRDASIFAKCREYEGFGIRNIWLIEPESHTGYRWTDGQKITSDRLEVPDTPIYVDVPELFSKLDDLIPQRGE